MAKPRNVNFSARARKDFEAFDQRVERRIADAIRAIAKDPLSGKKLKGELSAFRSYRLGAYRIIYRLTQDAVDIVMIEHRKDVYR